MAKPKQVVSPTPQMVDLADLLVKQVRQCLIAQNNSTIEQHIQAIILFQAFMEIIINEEIETNRLLLPIKYENLQLTKKFKILSFRNKWIKSYELLGIEVANSDLEKYLQFYTDFRVPITHPQSRFTNISKYTSHNTKKGIRTGLRSIKILFTKLNISRNYGIRP